VESAAWVRGRPPRGFQWSTAQMFTELMAYDARRLGTGFEVPFFLL
jgi:hypothetical protein